MKSLPNISEKQNKVLRAISKTAEELNIKAFVVGGFVRDYYLGIPNDDIDVVVEGSGIEFAIHMAFKYADGKYQFYENYGTAMVNVFGLEVEFVGARKEMYERGSRNPIVEEGTIKDDQLRRDFTINAMAFSLNKENFGELVDPFNGMEDLKNRIIRSVQDPNITFSDDPLRILRGIRFYVKLLDTGNGGFIDKKTEEGMAINAHRLSIISQERITEEINKMFKFKHSFKGIEKIYDLNLADKISLKKGADILSSPVICGYYKILITLGEFEQETENDYSLLKWFFLFYLQYGIINHQDIENITRNFKLPMSVADYCNNMASLINLFNNAKDFKEMYRYIPYLLKENWKDFFVMISSYGLGGKIDRNKFSVKKEWVEMTEKEANEFINWKCPLNGDEIGKELNLSPGIKLGRVKKALEKAILSNEIGNTKKESLKYIKSLKMA